LKRWESRVRRSQCDSDGSGGSDPASCGCLSGSSHVDAFLAVKEPYQRCTRNGNQYIPTCYSYTCHSSRLPCGGRQRAEMRNLLVGGMPIGYSRMHCTVSYNRKLIPSIPAHWIRDLGVLPRALTSIMGACLYNPRTR
jgi:hypothetical protein